MVEEWPDKIKVICPICGEKLELDLKENAIYKGGCLCKGLSIHVEVMAAFRWELVEHGLV